MTVIYSARWVLPIIAPVIEYGAIALEASQIVGVGPRTEIVSKFPEASTEDFGDSAILPGLVNAHSHLELTVMRGFLEREENDFSAWLRKLTLSRLAMTGEDLLVSATCGAIEAARAGVTCVGDASSVASQAINALRLVGLRGIIYQESFGPDPNLAAENVAKLRDQISELRALESVVVQIGVSPHAPYTVSAPQLELISRLSTEENLPVMMHAAESESERLFMLEGQGVFADTLRARGIEWQAPGISTIQYLNRHGLLETKPLFAHCVNVDDCDLELIKDSSAGIAHCPKSNAKLGHGRAPFVEFIKLDLNVGLGSDSMASNNACDMLEEGRFATLLARLPSNFDSLYGKRRLPAPDLITAEEALYTATLGGARALGLEDKIGALTEGMQADVTIVNLKGAHQQPVRDPATGLVFASSGRDVLLTMVAGKEIYRAGRVTGIDEGELRKRLAKVRGKIDLAA
jgi:5-methylthioadenosine/S-adenosylhomocysteine deaminase